ncbi:MAG: hypothetical protein SO009_02490 [Bacilli bacterium]|nr:hypothetical protein [Bacilli bacterium]
MNEEMLFYPPYPYQNIEEEYLNEYRGNGNLFTPNQTLEYGNIFKKEYEGYKGYQPYKINIKNEKCILNLIAMQDYLHDLKLYLDVYPNDNAILNEYNNALKKYQKIKENVDLSSLKCPMSENKNMFRGEIDV